MERQKQRLMRWDRRMDASIVLTRVPVDLMRKREVPVIVVLQP